jgi:hypothetical protein
MLSVHFSHSSIITKKTLCRYKTVLVISVEHHILLPAMTGRWIRIIDVTTLKIQIFTDKPIHVQISLSLYVGNKAYEYVSAPMKSIMIPVQIVRCYVEIACINFRKYSCTVGRRLIPRPRSLRIPGAKGDNAPSKCLCISNVILQSTPHAFRQSSRLRATTRLLSREIQS